MDLASLREIQENLRGKVLIQPLGSEPKVVAGCDSSYSRKMGLVVAVFVTFSYPELELLEVGSALRKVEFPYIPTYLSFRELPALLKAYKNLRVEPDLILVDGQGIAHPRGLGLASHLGVLLDRPTIGVAKSPLFGEFEMPGPLRGESSPILDGGRVIGAVLRTRTNVKPLFVSPGHRVTVEDSIKYVLELSRGYRLPEPIRYADRISRKLAKGGDLNV